MNRWERFSAYLKYDVGKRFLYPFLVGFMLWVFLLERMGLLIGMFVSLDQFMTASWCLFRIFLVFFIQDRVLSFFLFYSGFPMEEHLEAKVPPRVAFFVWTTSQGKIDYGQPG
uniref:Uncharacterized protein n=1 Tax=Fagus sylvatica TaxID=28930 RepID=A0A2N9EIZ1_FAGSY